MEAKISNDIMANTIYATQYIANHLLGILTLIRPVSQAAGVAFGSSRRCDLGPRLWRCLGQPSPG